MTNNSLEVEVPRFLSVRDLSTAYRWKIGGLRWLIFNSKKNGLDPAIRKIGRKILVDRFEFEKFIDSFPKDDSHARK